MFSVVLFSRDKFQKKVPDYYALFCTRIVYGIYCILRRKILFFLTIKKKKKWKWRFVIRPVYMRIPTCVCVLIRGWPVFRFSSIFVIRTMTTIYFFLLRRLRSCTKMLLPYPYCIKLRRSVERASTKIATTRVTIQSCGV